MGRPRRDVSGFTLAELLVVMALVGVIMAGTVTLLAASQRSYSAGAARVGQILRKPAGRSLQIMGPAPAPLERLRGEYRMQLLVRAGSRKEMQEALGEALAELEREPIRAAGVAIDVDPMSTL